MSWPAKVGMKEEREVLSSKSKEELEQIINDTVMENNILRSRAATALILSSSATILAKLLLEPHSPEFYSTLGVSALGIGYALRQAVRTARHGYLKTLVELYETKRQGRIRELYPR